MDVNSTFEKTGIKCKVLQTGSYRRNPKPCAKI